MHLHVSMLIQPCFPHDAVRRKLIAVAEVNVVSAPCIATGALGKIESSDLTGTLWERVVTRHWRSLENTSPRVCSQPPQS